MLGSFIPGSAGEDGSLPWYSDFMASDLMFAQHAIVSPRGSHMPKYDGSPALITPFLISPFVGAFCDSGFALLVQLDQSSTRLGII